MFKQPCGIISHGAHDKPHRKTTKLEQRYAKLDSMNHRLKPTSSGFGADVYHRPKAEGFALMARH